MEEGGKTINCILTRRAPSSQNGGVCRRDARPPPEMDEVGKTIDSYPHDALFALFYVTDSFFPFWSTAHLFALLFLVN